MLMSQIYVPTLREVPAEAELVSHQLMLRAGLMRKSTAGVYTYLPLGLRVIQNVMQIVREEMNKAGGQEILLPIIQPAELWRETRRWEDYGDEMFRLCDRHQREFCLGPTHEEIITALIRSDVRSYRQLPLRLYQIQNKYRDEIRPRFGVIRGREFIMKDLYSFDRDEEGLSHSYQAMYDAYGRVFSRCGLKALPVEADSGAIGGDTTHEFMVLASSGEALIVNCELCDYAANVERAECVVLKQEEALWEDVTELATPNVTTIADLATFTAWQPDRFIKTMIYVADEKPIAAVIRGDHSLNEVKLQKALGCTTLAMADAQTIESVTGSPPGYAGPVGLTIPIVADSSVVEVTNGIAGANKSDTHLTNVNYGRDYKATQISDIRQAAAGDACPRCQGRMLEDRGIEVGQVFKLGTKYSESLKASYLDESGRDHPIVMGCYGIGVSRTVAAVIEQHHDQDGICWPAAIAPYHVVIIPVSYKSESQRQTAHDLYEELQSGGYQVLLDDRNERPGVKFKDADLIGFPVRIVVGDRNLKNGQVEVINRRTKDKLLVVLSDVAPTCATLLRTNAKTT